MNLNAVTPVEGFSRFRSKLEKQVAGGSLVLEDAIRETTFKINRLGKRIQVILEGQLECDQNIQKLRMQRGPLNDRITALLKEMDQCTEKMELALGNSGEFIELSDAELKLECEKLRKPLEERESTRGKNYEEISKEYSTIKSRRDELHQKNLDIHSELKSLRDEASAVYNENSRLCDGLFMPDTECDWEMDFETPDEGVRQDSHEFIRIKAELQKIQSECHQLDSALDSLGSQINAFRDESQDELGLKLIALRKEMIALLDEWGQDSESPEMKTLQAYSRELSRRNLLSVANQTRAYGAQFFDSSTESRELFLKNLSTIHEFFTQPHFNSVTLLNGKKDAGSLIKELYNNIDQLDRNILLEWANTQDIARAERYLKKIGSEEEELKETKEALIAEKNPKASCDDLALMGNDSAVPTPVPGYQLPSDSIPVTPIPPSSASNVETPIPAYNKSSINSVGATPVGGTVSGDAFLPIGIDG